MEKRKLGQNSGLEVTTLIFGAWGISGPPFWKTQDRDISIKAIKTAVDHGVNMIDTAPVYGFGLSEELVGEAIRGRRDRVLIATKCGLRWKTKNLKGLRHDLSPDSVREEVEKSLERLGTDSIDLYQIHWPDPATPIGKTMETLARLKEDGKIRSIGVSNFTVDLLEEAMKTARIDSLQQKYNLLEREIEEELLPFCHDNGIGVIVYSPLSSGVLTGKYETENRFGDWRGRGKTGVFRKEAWPQAMEKTEKLKKIAERSDISLTHLAIQWVISQPGVTAAIVGSNTPEQVLENIEFTSAPISEEALAEAGRA